MVHKGTYMKANQKCIMRLSRYKKALLRLKTLGFVKVFSDNLADAVGVTSSQVRKDFSLFGITGKRKGGYKVEELLSELHTILGKDKMNNIIIVGMGNIGTALTKYRGFKNDGVTIVAGFDTDPSLFTQDEPVPVHSLDRLQDFVSTNKVTLGIIAVPDIAAQHVADILVNAGIRGILNFAPIRLRVPGDCLINNVNLGIEIENLLYHINTFPEGNNE